LDPRRLCANRDGAAAFQTSTVSIAATAVTADQELDPADRQVIARCLPGLPSRRTGIEGIATSLEGNPGGPLPTAPA